MPIAKPVLILLPGVMCDEDVWAPQIEAFSPTHQVLVPRFLGLDSFDAMADAALALTDGPFALAGHSMGGRVAMHLNARAPGRVTRLALLDTGAHMPTEKEAEGRAAMVQLAETRGIEALIAAWLPPMVAPAHRNDDALMDRIAAMLRRAGVEAYKGHVRALMARPDAWPQLDAITVPTAFITGALDGWSPPEQHAQMQSRVPGSTLTVIEGCGHMSTLEAPEAMNQALKEWLYAHD